MGLGLIKAAGGMTIAQGEQSCVVFGMPKAAIERGHAMRVVELEALASTLQAQCRPGREVGEGSRGGAELILGVPGVFESAGV